MSESPKRGYTAKNLVVATIIIFSFLGGGFASGFYAGKVSTTTLNTWDGNWFTAPYVNATTGLYSEGSVYLGATADTRLYRSGVDTISLGAGDSLIGATWLNSTNIKFTGNLYYDSTNYTAWIESIAGNATTLELDPTPTSDHSGNGLYASMTVGESVTIGQALYMKGDGKLWKSDANSTSTMPCVAIALGSISADVAGNVLKIGFIRDDTWNWTVGGLVFASWTTGGLTQTRPDGTGSQVQIVGYAVSADVIYFNPSYVLVEVS